MTCLISPKIIYDAPDYVSAKAKNISFCGNSAEKNRQLPTTLNYLDALANQNAVMIKKTPLNVQRLTELNIPNFALLENNGARGESLSSKKNRKFIIPVKKCGIKSVIDLRDKYTSGKYKDMCNNAGLNYYNFPIDSHSIEDRRIIESLPEMFDVINDGNFYIACAQGLHRTDIALALNYLFNPKSKDVPVMYGHFRDSGFKYDDIARRINSIYKNINEDDLKRMSWGSSSSFEKEFTLRKKKFLEDNRERALKK